MRSGNVSFLCLCSALSVITVCAQSVSGCRTCSVGRILMSSQCSHPASRELRSCVPVEAFLSLGHLGVDGFLNSSSLGCLAMSTTVVPYHLMAWWSSHACSAIADFSGVPLRQASCMVFSQPGLQSSPGLTNVALATTAGDSVHHLDSILAVSSKLAVLRVTRMN